MEEEEEEGKKKTPLTSSGLLPEKLPGTYEFALDYAISAAL